MPAPSSLTLNYDAILSTTLFNYRKTMEDQISTSNTLFYMLKKREDGWKEVSNIGERMQVPLMYGLGVADTYNGYDNLTRTPVDGITSAFWEWRQLSASIMISRREERQNAGEAKIVDLLKSKTKQAMLGLEDLFGRILLQGNGVNLATAITTPYTSANNTSLGFDPLPLLVKFDPTTSTVIGNLNQSTQTWWRNQFSNSAATTYAAFLKELRKLKNNCSKGPGGTPNLYIADQNVHEFIEAALTVFHQNPTWKKADIPFDNFTLFGEPCVWDEFVPDVAGGTTVQSTTSGTLFALNTKFIQLQVDSQTNFMNTPFERAAQQDAKSADILWMGGIGVSQRRKQGVMGSIDTTVSS